MEDDTELIAKVQSLQAKLIAGNTSKKNEEFTKKLQNMEQDVQVSTKTVERNQNIIAELREQLHTIGGNLKSLEVLEEKPQKLNTKTERSPIKRRSTDLSNRVRRS